MESRQDCTSIELGLRIARKAMRRLGSVSPSMVQTKLRLVRATCCTSQPASSSARNSERFIVFGSGARRNAGKNRSAAMINTEQYSQFEQGVGCLKIGCLGPRGMSLICQPEADPLHPPVGGLLVNLRLNFPTPHLVKLFSFRTRSRRSSAWGRVSPNWGSAMG
jgi:hypothetical protein